MSRKHIKITNNANISHLFMNFKNLDNFPEKGGWTHLWAMTFSTAAGFLACTLCSEAHNYFGFKIISHLLPTQKVKCCIMGAKYLAFQSPSH